MINIVKSEWIKLRTVTMNWVLTIIAVVFPSAIALLTAFFKGDDAVPIDAQQLLQVILATSYIPVLLMMVVAAASITSEFGFGTIRPTFTATPHRARVVLAKACVVVLFSIAVLVVVILITVLGGAAVATARGAHIDFGEVPTTTSAIVGLIVLSGLMAMVGLGVGMLARSTPATIAILIIWPLMAEGLVGSLIGLVFANFNVIAWMPFRVGFLLNALEVDGGPSRLTAGLYFGAVAVALCAVGTWFVQRRDA